MAITRNLGVPYSATGGRKEPRSENNNIRRLHAFFSRIVKASGEGADVGLMKIAKRLTMSNMNRPPVRVSAIAHQLGGSGKVAVVVAKVLDDERILQLPAMRIVALQWSKKAKAKVEACGGSISTLDQFVRVAGSLDNMVLVKGDPAARKATKFFGPAPGEKGSAAYPRVIGKSRHKEKRVNARKPVAFAPDSEE